jgi:hypothetical protein
MRRITIETFYRQFFAEIKANEAVDRVCSIITASLGQNVIGEL